MLLFVLFFSTLLGAKSILYKVESGSSTVYLLGSIHLAKPSLYPLDRAIEEAFDKSGVLVVELDPDSPKSVEVISRAMVHQGMYPAGQSLKSELTPQTYKALSAYVSQAGLSLQIMEPMRPWTVMLQLSVMEMMRLGYRPELGIDRHFLVKAKQAKKPVLEIESAQEQMDLLSRDDREFQDLLLRYTLESMHEMEPLLDKMFTSWKSGDAAALATVVNSPLVVDPRLTAIYDTLITKRNVKMTARIRSYLKTGKVYFVVVGAGHVIGEAGIVARLRRDGYKVTQK